MTVYQLLINSQDRDHLWSSLDRDDKQEHSTTSLGDFSDRNLEGEAGRPKLKYTALLNNSRAVFKNRGDQVVSLIHTLVKETVLPKHGEEEFLWFYSSFTSKSVGNWEIKATFSKTTAEHIPYTEFNIDLVAHVEALLFFQDLAADALASLSAKLHHLRVDKVKNIENVQLGEDTQKVNRK